MRFAIILDGRVDNVALADDPDFAAALGWVACGEHVGPGWSYDGVAFTPPVAASSGPEVVVAVTMRQARLALLASGHLAAVDALIASLPSPQREAAVIEWEYASEVRRDSPLVGAIGAARGLDEAAKDALFLDAASR